MVCNTLNNSIFIKKITNNYFDIEFGINFSLFINILFCNKIFGMQRISEMHKKRRNAGKLIMARL